MHCEPQGDGVPLADAWSGTRVLHSRTATRVAQLRQERRRAGRTERWSPIGAAARRRVSR